MDEHQQERNGTVFLDNSAPQVPERFPNKITILSDQHELLWI